MTEPLEIYSKRVTRLSKGGAAVTKTEWRWRLRASNGRIVADSGEGYSSRAKCRDGFRAAALLAVPEFAKITQFAIGKNVPVLGTKPVRKRK